MRKNTPVGNRVCLCGQKAVRWLGQEAVCETCAARSNRKRQTLAGSYHRSRTR